MSENSGVGLHKFDCTSCFLVYRIYDLPASIGSFDLSNILAGGSLNGLIGHEPLEILDLFKFRLRSSLDLLHSPGDVLGVVGLVFGAEKPVKIYIKIF